MRSEATLAKVGARVAAAGPIVCASASTIPVLVRAVCTPLLTNMVLLGVISPAGRGAVIILLYCYIAIVCEDIYDELAVAIMHACISK